MRLQVSLLVPNFSREISVANFPTQLLFHVTNRDFQFMFLVCFLFLKKGDKCCHSNLWHDSGQGDVYVSLEIVFLCYLITLLNNLWSNPFQQNLKIY